MDITIRQEETKDYSAVEVLVKAAFANEVMSDHTEHLLVNRLRKSSAFVPELSLVAVHAGKLVGHILLTKINIKEGNVLHPSLALAPVSVHPDFQGKGIGGQLILRSHQIATAMGFASIVLLGHQDYYPRFGYEPCRKYGIELPFQAPDSCCMVIALTPQGLDGVSGRVVYDPAFFA